MKILGWLFPDKQKFPEKRLKRLIDYTPDIYKTHKQYSNAVNFLKATELQLAAESLVELADESGHYFSDEFWKNLSAIFESFNDDSLRAYCGDKITGTKRTLGFNVTFGYSVEKINDTHFNHYSSQKINDKYSNERYIQDGIVDLSKKDGIYSKFHGRSGYIYFVKEGKLAEIYIEMEVNRWGAYFSGTQYWIYPVKQKLADDERVMIQSEVELWAQKRNMPIRF